MKGQQIMTFRPYNRTSRDITVETTDQGWLLVTWSTSPMVAVEHATRVIHSAWQAVAYASYEGTPTSPGCATWRPAVTFDTQSLPYLKCLVCQQYGCALGVVQRRKWVYF